MNYLEIEQKERLQNIIKKENFVLDSLKRLSFSYTGKKIEDIALKKRVKGIGFITCLPFFYTGIVEYCLGCNFIAPFDGNLHCFFCGCDHPHSSFGDFTVSEADFDSEVNSREKFIFLPNYTKPVFGNGTI